MLRTITLSMLFLFGVAFTLPFAASFAEGTHTAASHRYHKHSRAWWRRHRARLRLKREAALRLNRDASATASAASDASLTGAGVWTASAASASNASVMRGGTFNINDPRGLFYLTMPEGWSARAMTPNGDMNFRVFANNQMAGQALLSLVPSNLPIDLKRDDSGAMSRRSNRLLGQFAEADLRRIVIDKMIAAGGFVINDYEREIGGRKSFVVLAQTPASVDGRTPSQSWTFYFTEFNKRVYSLAMSTLPQYANQLTAQSEQLLTSFHARDNAALASAPGH